MTQPTEPSAVLRDPNYYLAPDEFLQAEGPAWAKLPNGATDETAGATLVHDELTQWLTRLFSLVQERAPAGRLLGEPSSMKTGPALPERSPDLFFVVNEHLDRLQPNHLAGPADIVIEVTGPSTAAVDRGAKFYEYEAGGVTEYWLIDPQRRIADFYRRDDDGYYATVTPEDGVFRSTVLPAMRFRVEWLWSLPEMDTVAAEIEVL